MKIAILRTNPVSPDSRVEKEAFSLKKAGHDVVVVGLDRSSNYKWRKDYLDFEDFKIPIFRIGILSSFGGGVKNLIPMFKFNKQLFKWLKNNRHLFECMHACDLDTGYTAMRISKKYSIPFVYDIFDYYSASHYFPNFLKKKIISLENGVINRSVCTIICSEKRKEQINGSKPKRLAVIHNSPSSSIFKNSDLVVHSSGSNQEKIKIGYVGILSKSRLLEEMVQIVQKRSDLELHIGGFGQLEEYIKKMSGDSDNIFFYGTLQYKDTLSLEQQMDILTAIYDPAVENHRFAAPNKFYEALMLGKPLIMVRDTGFDKTIIENHLGVLIDFSKEGFEIGIDELVSQKQEWPVIREKEKNLFEQCFSWDIMEKRLVEIYKDIEKEEKDEE